MKSIYSSAHYFLVHKLKISNKEAQRIIEGNLLSINSKPAFAKQPILPADEVIFNGEVLKEKQSFIYLIYHKPRGVESTMNTEITHNLMDAGKFPFAVFPVGRLDKASEGLLLLTNDGNIYNKIVASDQEQEKEYLVKVDRPLTTELIERMSSGMEILGKTTKPALVQKLQNETFSIVLTQGLNKQIRRMCKAIGFQVTFLQRTRIINLCLGDLPCGEWRYLTKEELVELKRKIYPIVSQPS